MVDRDPHRYLFGGGWADGRLAAIYLNRIYIANTKNGVAIVCYDPVENTVYESSPYARVAGIMPAWSNGLFALNGIFLADPEGVLGEWDTINQVWLPSTLHANSRTNGVVIVFNGEIWVLGSFTLSTAVDAYDPVTKVLSSKPSLTKARLEHKAVVINGSLYLFGGKDSGWSFLTDVEVYQ